ncbi:flagellar basal body rod protein FlgB [Ohessyouella blattaphilus]|uniref:Flagellar basal body rod protein FlgB n=1 Tax=Ohessyouella blattaphilus TaxID=2949333 RepID=A0ABT1EEJ9_9FIRM|nr:flagellar basal body rod protein FlgB [Ohessyouella blattaphilus]MCP1109113.1 flagellar basal body rod protein FlgB [Ohessyouella blattaphilus]MCR8562507.1 flagellar basal body rod protein FlgB [Ohessyouella blattaphilus]MDL2250318.1 flagellar basal body rod protein FlgB [Lachnospiraceae bacterium OttesenSCG-928-J05]
MSVGNNLWGNSINMMSKSLDYLWAKQKVTSDNIANAETPGYKSKYITFEESYQNKLKATAKKSGREASLAIGSARYQVKENNGESAKLDGNNVNTEVQMIELTRTALQYQYGIESVNKDIARLSTVIKGQ